MNACQEDEVSRLRAIIENLRVDYESTIRDLQNNLAKATATIAELDRENQQLVHTLQDIDQECSETTSSLESLVQENRDLRRRLDLLVHERHEIAAKLNEEEHQAEHMPVDHSVRNDKYTLLTNEIVKEEKYWGCLQQSHQSMSRKQNSYNTIGTLTTLPAHAALNDSFPVFVSGESILPNIQISRTDLIGPKKGSGPIQGKKMKSTLGIFQGISGISIIRSRRAARNDLLVEFGNRLRPRR
jgi:hypothetical protein